MATALSWKPQLPTRIHRHSHPSPFLDAGTGHAFQCSIHRLPIPSIHSGKALAFRRDFDRFAKDAWRTANDGFEQFLFEAKKTAERIDRRYSVSRRLSAVAQSASDRARDIDREYDISVRWRTFSIDFNRNWPRSQIDDLEGPKKELFADASEDKKYQSSGSLNNHEKLNNVNNAVEMIEKLAAAAAAVDPNERVIESFTGSGRKGSDKTAPPSWSPDIVNQVPFEINEDNHPYVGDFDLLGEMGSLSNSRVNQGTEFFPPPHQSMNLMDLLTGDDWSSPQIPARKLEDKVDFGSDISCLLEPHVHVGSLRSGLENLRSKDREASSISDDSHFPDHHVHMVSMIHAPKDLGSTENVRTG